MIPGRVTSDALSLRDVPERRPQDGINQPGEGGGDSRSEECL